MSYILFLSGIVLLNLAIFHVSNQLPLLEKSDKLKNPFVGFYVFPHGGITLDPANMDYSSQPSFDEFSRDKAIKLHNAMERAAEALVESKPDLIIFSTPHGFHLDNKNLILSARSTYGTAGDIWENFTASFDIDTELSSIVYAELKGAKDRIELLSFATGYHPMPLLWAEVIPWYFIREAAAKTNFELPKAIYVGQPPTVHLDSLKNVGRDIAKTALLRKEFEGKRIAVVISGDLSHYHSNDTQSPYPYNPISEEFDKYIVNWAKLDRNSETEGDSATELLKNAGKIQGEAGHCGYTGLVMIHGMLEELVNQGWNYNAKFYEYDAPTYFGMMIASWVPV